MSDTSRRIDDLSPEERRALLAKMRRSKARATQSFPLSFAQQRLWFLDQLVPGSSLYNIPMALRLTGALKIAVLRRSLTEIVRRHAVLRTTFEVLDGQPVQVIHPAATLPLPLIDLQALAGSAREAQARQLIQDVVGQPFDLARGPLVRSTLLRLAPHEHILLLNVHHIVFDGWSLDILQRESSALYNALAAGKPSPLAELPIQYADFTVWQRRRMQGEVLEAQLAYWRQKLHDLPVLDLPTDFPRPPVQAFQGAWETTTLAPSLDSALATLSQQAGTTLFMIFLATFKILLARYSGQADIAVGTAVANRSRPEIKGMIGFFANTLVLRTDLSGDPSFREALGRVRTTCLDAYAHQDLPFEQLVMALRPDRDLSHQPLVQTTFALQPASGAALPLDNLSTEYVYMPSEMAKYDLSLNIFPSGGRLQTTAEYHTDLFEPATIVRLLDHWRMLLEGIVANPDQRISALPLLTDAERRQLLVEWNATSADYPHDTSAHSLFEAQVERTPDATAVFWKDTVLTYRELDRRAQQLAHYLRRLEIGLEVVVALGLDRSIDFLIAMLGIWKAGAAYVPLDPTYPRERLDFMLRASHARVLLTQTHLLDKLPATSVPTICLDRAWGSITREHATSLSDQAAADNLAYIIYTSGSTGQPKGVLATHRGLCNVVAMQQTLFAPLPGDIILQFASVSFDASISEIVLALWNGASLRVAEDESRLPGPILAELLRQWDVTMMILPPPVLAALPDSALPAAHTISVAGDVCPADVVARWAPGRRFFNLYGPTEASIWASAALCVSDTAVTIGRPIANTQIYLLDAQMQPVPLGVPGDLYIGGVGITRGYIDRPDLTAERFVPNPFADHRPPTTDHRPPTTDHRTTTNDKETKRQGEGESETQHSTLKTQNSRLYKTGDLARYRPDGNIEFLGRTDDQVKLRGFRIELGEIETALAAHPAVREAVVAIRTAQAGDKRLVAYVIPTNDQRPTTNDQRQGDKETRGQGENNLQSTIYNLQSAIPETLSSILYPLSSDLRAFLKERLPDYMVPASFVMLEALPLSPNGKVDRRALPDPAGQAILAVAYSAPQTDVEQTIARIWQEVLQIDRVGREANFFDLGGHSLLLAQVHTRLRDIFGARLALLDLFRYPTVSALAAYLAPDSPIPDSQADDAQPELSHAGEQQSGSDIAIVGMAGRFAGAKTVREFWQQLCDGVELISFFTDQELASAGIDPAALGDPHYVKASGYMPDIDLFDAAFFGISPREAVQMDPQQRLFLECVWEALENAGYNPATYQGRIGLYAGASTNWYQLHHLFARQQADEFQGAIGSDRDHLPTRVSYKLNLTGPSVNVQTTCSTSLVAVHLACRSLLAGECEMALAGGASIQLLGKGGYFYQEGGILSPDGHCRPFDADAQGTVGGCGMGVVLLKRLDAALADGDYIYALIKGSAINNDGAAKAGYTAPSIAGQAAVISAAHAAAGVAPETIGYVEAHGTGTPLGDPIEVAALMQAFRAPTSANRSCALGSVKSNIGHLDAAAGIAGLIKAVLALQHRHIPPSLHFKQPNRQIDFDASPFYVNTALAEWKRGATPRRAGVSSFGIGGTNAHVVLEEASLPSSASTTRPWHLLVLSARTAAALEAATDRLAAYLRQAPDLNIADIAYTLQVGRKAFAQRRICVCSSVEDAARALESRDAARVFSAATPEQSKRSIAFLFPGQGAQYAGMAADLYQSEPVFRDYVDRCAALLTPLLGLDLREVLYPAEGSGIGDQGSGEASGTDEPTRSPTPDPRPPALDQTWLAQPALFVVEYALAQLVISWGIQPAALIGHSIGEYVAACLAGVFTLEDALRLVVRRGQLMQSQPGGAMLAVPLPEQQLRPLLGDDLALAAINGPAQCVVAGRQEAIDRLAALLAERDLETQRLRTSHAFHSSMMEPIVAAFIDEVRNVSLSPPRMPYLSNVTGTWITAEDATDPGYWGRHLRQTVRFADGIGAILHPSWVLLEVGPGRSLGATIRRQFDIPAGQIILSTVRHHDQERSDVAFLLESAGRLWLTDLPIHWPGQYAHERRQRVPLPSYPFERQRYWLDLRVLADAGKLLEPPLRKRSDIADWFYAPFWKETLPPDIDQTAAAQALCWLILADSLGVGDRVAVRLQQTGQTVISVRSGTQFAAIDETSYTIDPQQPHMYEALVADLRARSKMPSAIMHCWSITADDAPCSPLERCAEAQERGYYSLIFLAQALAGQHTAGGLRIGVVSNGMHRISGAETLRPEKATLLGFCRVIGQEYPHSTCRSIDIVVPEPRTRPADLLSDRLIAELLAPPADLVIAYRSGRRWVQTFEAVRQEGLAKRPPRLREGGVYLITGGLGGMGLAFAAYLAQTAHARLVLIGRSAFPAREVWPGWLVSHDAHDRISRAIRHIQVLEGLGAQVHVFQADAADLAQMQAIVEQVYTLYGAIHGVVHAAGVGGGGIIALQTPRKLAAVLAPKVQATLVLAALFDRAQLDFLVLCSSLRSITGGFGAVDYCAANAFLDGFAQSSSAEQGTFTVSVNWDAWSDVGMTAEGLKQLAQDSASASAEGMSSEEGVEVFRRILSASLPQLAIATCDLDALIAREQANAVTQAAASGPQRSPAQAAHPRPELLAAYVAPETEVERNIADIWQEVFGIAPIGIHDNFFELGGDSIVGLQVAARAKRFGLRLSPKQLFEHQTIAQLAAAVEQDQPVLAEQGLVTGIVPLTPIQSWFFEQDLDDRHHWNQALIFAVRQPIDPTLLERAFQELLAQHDALRMRFVREGAAWQQINTDETSLPLVYHDLSMHPAAEQATAIEATATTLQTSLDLANGPILRIALFNCGAYQPGRLLIIAHHLVMDAVSWRIVIEDLHMAYEHLSRGEAVQLPPKTTSFKQWAERLAAHAQSDELRRELDHWLAPARSRARGLAVDYPQGQNTIESLAHLHASLDAEATAVLLQELPATYHIQPYEVLLTALAAAVTQETGDQVLWVDLEGHGREDLFADIDLSRTVGWFTTIFPVCLDLSAASDQGAALQAIKTQMRSIPNGGIGYGLLRHLSRHADVREQIAAQPRPEISFLYLGQVDQQASLGSALIEPTQDAIGPAQSPLGRRGYLLEISAWLVERQLHFEWRYSTQMHRHDTIERITGRFVDALRSLIHYCQTHPFKGYTVADFPQADLSQEDLDALIANLDTMTR